MNVRFSEYRPIFPVNQAVQAYWTGNFNLYSEDHCQQSVVPNGCVELIIHLTTGHCELIRSGNWENSPVYMIIGMHTGAYTVRFPQPVQVFGIRFNPDGFYSLFGIPPAHLGARFEDSSDVLGRSFNAWCHRLRTAAGIEERIRIADAFLLRQWEQRTRLPGYLQAAPEIVRKYRGLISMDALMHEVHISPRQLQRSFKKQFGITAKEYIRLARLSAVQQYMQSERVNLTQVSYEVGFTDQSHFIREFKMLTGINPKGFLQQRHRYISNPVSFA